MFELCVYNIPEFGNPSCLHATIALVILHPSSHTVPQPIFTQTSTLPSSDDKPPPSWILPSVQSPVKLLQDYNTLHIGSYYY